MMLQVGPQTFGKDLINLYNKIFEEFKTPITEQAIFQILRMYSSFFVLQKETKCIEILLNNTNNLKKIAIVGSVFPLSYLNEIHKKYPNVEFIIIDEGYFFLLFEKYLKEKYNVSLIKINPLFNDISEYIEDVDLIIYPETELLIPFEMLKYKNKKMIFVVNYFNHDHKLNINVAYNEQDLADMCCIENVVVEGVIDTITSQSHKKTYYVLGKQNDC
jgi:hypothetical protein